MGWFVQGHTTISMLELNSSLFLLRTQSHLHVWHPQGLLPTSSIFCCRKKSYWEQRLDLPSLSFPQSQAQCTVLSIRIQIFIWIRNVIQMNNISIYSRSDFLSTSNQNPYLSAAIDHSHYQLMETIQDSKFMVLGVNKVQVSVCTSAGVLEGCSMKFLCRSLAAAFEKWGVTIDIHCSFSILLFNQCSGSVVSNSLRPHGLQHVRLPCLSTPKFAQIHLHQVGDVIQPSHPLSSPSPPAFNLSQHQGLFQWVGSSHQMAKVSELQLQHQSFEYSGLISLGIH